MVRSMSSNVWDNLGCPFQGCFPTEQNSGLSNYTSLYEGPVLFPIRQLEEFLTNVGTTTELRYLQHLQQSMALNNDQDLYRAGNGFEKTSQH